MSAAPALSDPSPSNPLIQELIHKFQTVFPHLIIPTWAFSPLVCFYLLKTGSSETRFNIFLVLIYQSLFIRKTHFLREVLFQTTRPAEYLKKYRLIFEGLNDLPQEKCLFCFHPHGFFAMGVYLAILMNPTFRKTDLAGSRMALANPLGGIIMQWLGVEGANPQNFDELLRKNRNIILLPGGFEESTITRYGKQRVFLKNRKGFIKKALEFGYCVYPIYTIGETHMMHSLSNEKLGLFLNKLKLPGALPYSKRIILPNSEEELKTIVGEKIELPLIKKPTKEDIDKYHELYITNLKNMYEKHRRDGDEDLEIL